MTEKPEKIHPTLLQRKVTHGPTQRHLQEYELDRAHLHDSTPDINGRDWNTLLQKEEKRSDLVSLRALHQAALPDCASNKPALKEIERLLKLPRRPLMLCEFGFGDTTYRLLEWCVQNNAYLVTVEMPIASQTVKDSEDYAELYWWGVDRYHQKYSHCVSLRNHPIAQKRWLWVMDDCYKVMNRIASDVDYRSKLFYKGSIDYFYEDAIHDNDFHAELFGKVRPFMLPGSIFTGDDNAPTHIV